MILGVLWLLRHLILTRLTASVRHEYELKIESMRSDLRKTEETFKVELHSKQAQLDKLRDTLFSGFLQRQSVSYQKTVAVVDIIWCRVVKLEKVEGYLRILRSTKYDAAMKLSSENLRVKDMFENVFSSLSIESIDANDSLSCRPFMSKASWALFYAYHSILAHGFLKIEMLKNGIEYHKDVVDDESIKQVILAVLPQKKDLMASMTPESYSYFIQEIKELLLLELRNMLEGREQDEQILARSTAIIEAAQALSSKL